MAWTELKFILYIWMTAFSAVLLVLCFNLSRSTSLPDTISAVTLLVTGCILLIFGVLTYVLREDPDIWR